MKNRRLKVILATNSAKMRDAWQKYCGDLPFVEIRSESIIALDDVDAIVSPANSFLTESGGLDAAITERVGLGVKKHAQNKMKKYHGGRLLVGQAMAVETRDRRIRNVIYAPTMARTTVLPDETENVYLATRGVLLLDKEYAKSRVGKKPTFRTIAFPALGTGAGHVSLERCAMQMRAALDEVVLGK